MAQGDAGVCNRTVRCLQPHARFTARSEPAPGSSLSSFAGTSSSVLRHTWAACASPTSMLPQRYPSKVQSSDSGPVRNGPLSVSPTCPSCVPTRSRQSRSHDGKAVAGFSTYFSSCTGLHLLAKIATGVEESVWVYLFKILFLWTTVPGKEVHLFPRWGM